MDFDEAAKTVKGELEDKKEVSLLRRIWRVISQPHLGLPVGENPEVVKEAGWGVVYHKDEDPAVKAAVEPLFNHRRSQIENDDRVKILEYRDGESRGEWLARHGVGAGTIEPTKVPYYLLFVGSPERIPFTFCHQLDVDTPSACCTSIPLTRYSRYVKSVIAYETEPNVPNSKRLSFSARATTLTAPRR